jgi:hypothetical protein
VLQFIVTVNVVPGSPILVTLMMEGICFTKTLVLTKTKWCNILEDGIHLFNTLLLFVIYCYRVLLCQELVRSFNAYNKSKSLTSVPDSGGGEDFPPQSIPSDNAKPKKSLHTVPSSASLYGTDIVVEEHRLLVESIARHIVYGESLCMEQT